MSNVIDVAVATVFVVAGLAVLFGTVGHFYVSIKLLKGNWKW